MMVTPVYAVADPMFWLILVALFSSGLGAMLGAAYYCRGLIRGG
jgi:hypothetical protein